MNPVFTKKLQVASLPTVFAIYQGQLMDQVVGALPESEFKKWFDTILAASMPFPSIATSP